jgi:hypothetical protein
LRLFSCLLEVVVQSLECLQPILPSLSVVAFGGVPKPYFPYLSSSPFSFPLSTRLPSAGIFLSKVLEALDSLISALLSLSFSSFSSLSLLGGL